MNTQSYCDQWLQLEDRFSTLDSFELFFPGNNECKGPFSFRETFGNGTVFNGAPS
jgi:hypothetical protein